VPLVEIREALAKLDLWDSAVASRETSPVSSICFT